ncbi:MAG: cysteine desulfurase family protein [Christensenellales bacterium]|jgi:cysteine desulfurase
MIYLDNAATTVVYEDTLKIIKSYLTEKYFNPSALYGPANDVANDIKDARKAIAGILGATQDEIYFVSSGTEADNIALLNSRKKESSEIVISAVEHAAVFNTALELRERGYNVKFAPVDKHGRVIKDEFVKLINENTSLVSIIHVSNETGAVNDIKALADVTKSVNNRAIFHSDGVQAFTKVQINLSDTKVDLYSVSGHKIHAPKGIAALYIRKGVNIKPVLYGGGQEKSIRSSTENVAGIIALKYAANKSTLNYAENYNNMVKLLQITAQNIIKGIPDAIINTNFDNSAPNILSIAFNNIRGEVLMHSLEKYDIYVGIGSACTSKKGIKRIPGALDLPRSYHDGMIRISINPETKADELEYFTKSLINEHNNLIKYTGGR